MTDPVTPPPPPLTKPVEHRVIVTDFDMPFGSMVGFMIKWSIAAIPALIVLSILAVMIVLLLGGLGSSLSNFYQ